MSVSGSLETMSLPDICQFISLGQKTGVLSVESGLVRKTIVFEKGIAVHCMSDSPKEFLGQHLLARTAISESDLEEAFRTQDKTGRRLGEILVESGRLTEDELRTVLEHKITDSMYELLTWTSGAFEFEEGEPPAELVPIRVAICCNDLMMEGARRADETARIRQLIPGLHARLVPRRDKFPAGFPETSGDRKLIELVEQGLTVARICPCFHASDFQILDRLAKLVGDGLLEVDAESLEATSTDDSDLALRDATRLVDEGRLGEAVLLLREGVRRFETDRALDTARQRAEEKLHQDFAHEHGPLAVPHPRVSLDELVGVEMNEQGAFLLSQINGVWSVRALVQLCPFDEIEVLAILDALLVAKIVELRAPAETSEPEPAGAPA